MRAFYSPASNLMCVANDSPFCETIITRSSVLLFVEDNRGLPAYCITVLVKSDALPTEENRV